MATALGPGELAPAQEQARQALLGSANAEGDAGAASEAVPSSDAGNESGAPLRANGAVDRPTGLVSLSIETEPPGAAVIRQRDGVRLGTTPYLYEIEAAPGQIAFVLQLEGYRSTSLSLPSDRDSIRQLVLLPGKGGAVIPAPTPDGDIAPEPPTKSPTPTPTSTESNLPKADRKNVG